MLALTVILIIYAYRKDQGMMRERIILGLTMSSAIYSAICIVPLQAYEPDCNSVITPRGGAWIRISWFAIKCEEPPTANTRAGRFASCARLSDRLASPWLRPGPGLWTSLFPLFPLCAARPLTIPLNALHAKPLSTYALNTPRYHRLVRDLHPGGLDLSAEDGQGRTAHGLRDRRALRLRCRLPDRPRALGDHRGKPVGRGRGRKVAAEQPSGATRPDRCPGHARRRENPVRPRRGGFFQPGKRYHSGLARALLRRARPLGRHALRGAKEPGARVGGGTATSTFFWHHFSRGSQL